MDKQLLNYKKQDNEYLDGRYFNIALRDIPNVIQQPLVIRVNSTGAYVVGGLALIKVKGTQYMRIIIEFIENAQLMSQGQMSPRQTQNNYSTIQIPQIPQMSNMSGVPQVEAKIISKHSNLLIIDNINKRIQRFEPLDNNNYSPYINQALMKLLEPAYSGYTYNELSVHPQKDNIKLCIAYVIKFVYFNHHEGVVSFEGNYDIYQFGKAIVKLYGLLDERNKDVEFGYGYGYNPYRDVALGATGAGLIGIGALGLATGNPLLGAAGLVGGTALLSAPGFY